MFPYSHCFLAILQPPAIDGICDIEGMVASKICRVRPPSTTNVYVLPLLTTSSGMSVSSMYQAIPQPTCPGAT